MLGERIETGGGGGGGERRDEGGGRGGAEGDAPFTTGGVDAVVVSEAGRALMMSSMLARSFRGSPLVSAGSLAGISLSKTCVASSSSSQSMSNLVPLDGAGRGLAEAGPSLLEDVRFGVFPTSVGSSLDDGADGVGGAARLGRVERPGGGIGGLADVEGRIEAGGGRGGGPDDGAWEGGAEPN